MDQFDFCTMEKIDKSLRYRILQLRDEGVPEFKNVRMVPAYDTISIDVFAVCFKFNIKQTSHQYIYVLTNVI